jgi:pyrroline-5-carboxylate reductase
MSDRDAQSVLLVGAGRMGSALLRGWLAQGWHPSQIAVREPHPAPEVAALLAEQGIASTFPGKKSPNMIMLAVKPQIMDEVVAEVAPLAGRETVVLSVAAGRTISSLAARFGEDAAIVRSIPNLPAEIGRGITAACANANVSEDQRAACDRLLRAVGDVEWIEDETLIDAITAVSGSGPAYVFHLVECLAAAGEAQGLESSLAMRLARGTVIGAAELLHQSPLAAAELRENVTSPAGTTAAALSVLMAEPGMRNMLSRAVDAATKRSRELSS